MSQNEAEGDFRVQGKLGEGTFSQVLRMKHRLTGRTLAMKRFKKRFKSLEEVECLREIQALKRVNPHPNLIQLEDILFDAGSGTLYLAFELMDCNLYDLVAKKTTAITEAKIKLWFFQICKGLEFLHSKGIFHRDIKPENILIRDSVIVKLADLGSCRGVHSKGPFTEYIATRWYRPPETLLTSGKYNYKMDMWGAGCVLYESITKQPLFPGADALDQLHRIHKVMGSPSDVQLRAIMGPKMEGKFTFPVTEGTGILLPAPFSGDCHALLLKLLEYTPDDRYSATQALAHAFFRSTDFSELPPATQALYQGQIAAAANATAAPTAHHAPAPPAAAVPGSNFAHVVAAAMHAEPTADPSAPLHPRAAYKYTGLVTRRHSEEPLSSHGRPPPPPPAAPPAVGTGASSNPANANDGYLMRLLRRKRDPAAAPSGSTSSHAGPPKPLLPTLGPTTSAAHAPHAPHPPLAPARMAVKKPTELTLPLPRIPPAGHHVVIRAPAPGPHVRKPAKAHVAGGSEHGGGNAAQGEEGADRKTSRFGQ
ncbi:CMGC/RCK protein kinase [Allomyces macrogynus ATCC 38327]|uniref:CMGC/RCK protein kinase n=1 Tax=Allomyces macrogynus (strain ATCC 38327) TaxID=578462 RepID=A0A0L0SEP0_ALLM3|nr:CMGC/RCK protein kinase [Allomyces macrogynus ATCC 38327]|eukprot:KNE60904.1 CMGC/RCK protein kinase [Allomyces macrogynus ATCC 38327]